MRDLLTLMRIILGHSRSFSYISSKVTSAIYKDVFERNNLDLIAVALEFLEPSPPHLNMHQNKDQRALDSMIDAFT